MLGTDHPNAIWPERPICFIDTLCEHRKEKAFTIEEIKRQRTMSSDTFSKIEHLFQEKFHGSTTVSPQTALTDLGLDSLTLMEFVFAIEDAFEIRIPEDRIDPRQGSTTLEQVCTIIDEIKAQNKK